MLRWEQLGHFTHAARVFLQQVEREKADLTVQVITLQERLEEAEGGAENQVILNIVAWLSDQIY